MPMKMRRAGLIMVSLSPSVHMMDLRNCSVVAPSEIPFSDQYPKPKALDEEGFKKIDDAFVAAIERCRKVGCT